MPITDEHGACTMTAAEMAQEAADDAHFIAEECIFALYGWLEAVAEGIPTQLLAKALAKREHVSVEMPDKNTAVLTVESDEPLNLVAALFGEK